MQSHWTGQFAHFDKVVRTSAEQRTRIELDECLIGGADFVVMAGPCSVESERQLMETAEQVCAAGARVLRGGAFKPRSSPYSFQGLGLEGLKLLAAARRATGLAVVTEAMSELDVPLVAEYADMVQIGARSMGNTSLLQAVGGCGRPVLLKRGMTATLSDLLEAAQTIAEWGNGEIALCERGIRTFDSVTRNTFDISAVPVLRAVTHLPVVVDPSHAAGIRELVPVLARTAVVADADGLLVEVHPNPAKAWSDGEQSLTPGMFAAMMADLKPYLALRGREPVAADWQAGWSVAAGGGD